MALPTGRLNFPNHRDVPLVSAKLGDVELMVNVEIQALGLVMSKNGLVELPSF